MSNILSFKKWKSLLEFEDFDPEGQYSTDDTLGYPTGDVDSGKALRGGKGGNWDGSMQKALAFAKVAQDFIGRDLITSQKRSKSSTASGYVSDHYKGQENSYAVDLAVRSLSEGDRILSHLMDWAGVPGYKGEKWLNFVRDGYRYQVGWRVKDHYDHIHIGVRYVGPTVPDTKDAVLSNTSDPEGKDPLPTQVDKIKMVLKNRGKKSSSGAYPFKDPESIDYDDGESYIDALEKKKRWEKAQEYKKYLDALKTQ